MRRIITPAILLLLSLITLPFPLTGQPVIVPATNSIGPDPTAVPRNGYAFYVYEHEKYRYNLELHAWKCDECWRNPVVRQAFLVDEQSGTFGVNIWRCRRPVLAEIEGRSSVCFTLKKVATVRIAANGDGVAKWPVPFMPDKFANPGDADNPLYENAFRSGDQLIVESAPGLEVHVDRDGNVLEPFVSILDRGSADPTTRPLVPRRFLP